MNRFDIGFLGGGQLARMSIMAAQKMGLGCLSIDPGSETPASQVAPSLRGKLDDPEALAPLFGQCVMVTLENEFVPAKAIARAMQLAGRPEVCLVPNLSALATIQDKLTQNEALRKAGVPSPDAVALDGDGTLAVSRIGFPMMLKARFGGYDGKGTRRADSPDMLESYSHLWRSGGGWMAEEFVDFKRELAVMVYAGRHGVGVFPTMECVQINHVCDVVFPADVDASRVAISAVQAVGGIGLYGVELFEAQDGSILVNEIAPRPHNSGHYSMDWGGASQFDQHIRMTLGMPPAPLDGVPTAMANLMGQGETGDWRIAMLATLASDPGLRFHWYCKSESRVGRKMGHLNAIGADGEARARAGREVFYKAWASGAESEAPEGPD